ncbi:hypothetical protein Prudu_018566 [Prunus dulcis]|uniref:Uncharacterized protein n=1 Tax=Prunus dulcis TaxID=3755 RepID=A0A4Y1RSN3_PRUDU|nr:hypothetical protein Prudu_018566 [Prunus dulcis]
MSSQEDVFFLKETTVMARMYEISMVPSTSSSLLADGQWAPMCTNHHHLTGIHLGPIPTYFTSDVTTQGQTCKLTLPLQGYVSCRIMVIFSSVEH